ncbi:hypothetical protein N0V90_008098 [Kalmusia sp. IMI 367209]|nr:hypothetical protein N0V90_008098 [Kalmusia sp. IMI 367209]
MSVFKLPIEVSRHDVYDFVSPHAGTQDAAKGKNVLITGGGTGIGEVMAKYFVMAGAAQIVLAGRRPQPLEQSKSQIDALGLPVKVLTIATDVANPKSVAALFSEAGRVDILINNAGAYGQNATFVKGNVDEWWTAFDVNVKGTYMVTQAWLRSLNGGPGVVLNLSSRSSYVAVAGLSSYEISKSALNRLTELVDKEHGKEGVVAIAFHPGGVAGTELSKHTPEWLQATFKDTPDLAGATSVYLSTPRAAFLSGRFVNAQWNMEQLEGLQDTIVADDLLKMRVLGIVDQV